MNGMALEVEEHGFLGQDGPHVYYWCVFKPDSGPNFMRKYKYNRVNGEISYSTGSAKSAAASWKKMNALNLPWWHTARDYLFAQDMPLKVPDSSWTYESIVTVEPGKEWALKKSSPKIAHESFKIVESNADNVEHEAYVPNVRWQGTIGNWVGFAETSPVGVAWKAVKEHINSHPIFLPTGFNDDTPASPYAPAGVIITGSSFSVGGAINAPTIASSNSINVGSGVFLSPKKKSVELLPGQTILVTAEGVPVEVLLEENQRYTIL